MLVDHTQLTTPIEPAELAMLQRVFDAVCDRRHISKNSRNAEDIAAQTVNYFQHGIKDERQLLLMML